MTKRIAIALLWFYAGWYAGAILAGTLGMTPVIGPILGASIAVIVISCLQRMVWSKTPPSGGITLGVAVPSGDRLGSVAGKQ